MYLIPKKTSLPLLGFLALLAATSAQGARANDKYAARILACDAEYKGFSARLEVTEKGSAYLNLGKTPTGEVTSCALGIRTFSYKGKSVVPRVNLIFDRGSCEPAASEKLEKELLKDVTLIVKNGPDGKRVGRVQWLRFEDTMPCEVSAFQKDELKLDAESFRAGKWGR